MQQFMNVDQRNIIAIYLLDGQYLDFVPGTFEVLGDDLVRVVLIGPAPSRQATVRQSAICAVVARG